LPKSAHLAPRAESSHSSGVVEAGQEMSERGEFVFSNARLALEDEVALGSLTIQGGRIAEIATRPARMAGFEDRGRPEPGLRADLVRVLPTAGPPIVRGVWREGERVA
jgi:alpha-D-ribose 1-methylphosphonate 5-triphosphate diphosphatase PhnM